MSKKTIIIASVLKPVNDTRMYEKFAHSLSILNKYNINIIGFTANRNSEFADVVLHPIFNFKRISLDRIFASFSYYKKLKTLSPDLIIFNTHELLIPTIIYKWFHRVKVIYDVRENHFRNILFTNSFPKIVRPLLAIWIRSKEYFFSSWIDHFLLAEKYYQKEIHFTKNRHTLIENKANIALKKRVDFSQNPDKIQLLFSGTLAESTGVFQAIDFVKKMHKLSPKINLKIIGYSPRKNLIDRINSEIKGADFITLIGGNSLVDHKDIVEEISNSNFGIICYPSNKSTINSTPTKLYEYLSSQLPILIQNHDKWSEICNNNNAGISLDFSKYDPKTILEQMIFGSFYHDGIGNEFSWESEEKKLLQIVAKYSY